MNNKPTFKRLCAVAIAVLTLVFTASTDGQTAMERDKAKAERLKSLEGTWVQTSSGHFGSEYPAKMEVTSGGNVKCMFEGTDRTERALLKETKEEGTFEFTYKRMNNSLVRMKTDGTYNLYLLGGSSNKLKDGVVPKPSAQGKKQ